MHSGMQDEHEVQPIHVHAIRKLTSAYESICSRGAPPYVAYPHMEPTARYDARKSDEKGYL